MNLCIYASEVAKLAGMHKYESQESAIQKVCQRQGVDAAKSANTLHQKAVDEEMIRKKEAEVAAKIVTTKTTEVETLRAIKPLNDPLIKIKEAETVAALTVAQTTLKRAQDAMHEVQHTKRVATEALKEQQKAEVCTKTVQTPEIAQIVKETVQESKSCSTALATPALRQKLETAAAEAATPQVPAATVLRALTSEVACRMGDKMEPVALQKYQQITKQSVELRQKGFTSRAITTPQNNKYVLFGRTDGLRDDHVVVETKNRQSRFLGVPPYERIQLHVYMIITNTNKSVLVENLNGEQRSHDVEFDRSFWNEEILPALNQGVDQVFERL